MQFLNEPSDPGSQDRSPTDSKNEIDQKKAS
jgi:hypothetical protein